MRAEGILFTGKTKPQATTARDGTFALTLLAFDRIGPHQVEPWRISYYGPDAQAFWKAESAALSTPGLPLQVCADRMRTFGGGRYGASEVTATVRSISLAPPAHKNTAQAAQNVCEQLSNSEQQEEQQA